MGHPCGKPVGRRGGGGGGGKRRYLWTSVDKKTGVGENGLHQFKSKKKGGEREGEPT